MHPRSRSGCGLMSADLDGGVIRTLNLCTSALQPDSQMGIVTQGDVLEVSAGTGRNLPYYRYDQLSSLTLTDSSKHMLWHANKKFQETYAPRAASLPVSFFLSDAQQLVTTHATAAASTADSTAEGLHLPT